MKPVETVGIPSESDPITDSEVQRFHLADGSRALIREACRLNPARERRVVVLYDPKDSVADPLARALGCVVRDMSIGFECAVLPWPVAAKFLDYLGNVTSAISEQPPRGTTWIVTIAFGGVTLSAMNVKAEAPAAKA